MVNRVSTSGAALLACLAGCLASVNPAAVAGDKIEFSPAPDALAVPHSERTIRQDPATMIRETLSSHRAEGSDFSGRASGNYVTIIIPTTTTTKAHDRFGWTAPFEQPQDQDSDSLDLFPAKRTASTQTNSWSVSSDTDSSISKAGNWAKDAPWAQPDRGLARFSVEESLKSGDQDDGWLSRRFDAHSSGQDWSRGFGSHESNDPVRSGYEGYAQSHEDFGAYSRQPFGAFSQSDEGGGDDAMSMPTASSKTSLSDWSSESLRNQSEQLQTQPSIAETYDQLPTVAHPFVRSSERDQTYSTQRQAPSAPTVLPFPQRPGSLFQ